MDIEWKCNQCGEGLTIDDSYSGKKVACPTCKCSLCVPLNNRDLLKSITEFKFCLTVYIITICVIIGAIIGISVLGLISPNFVNKDWFAMLVVEVLLFISSLVLIFWLRLSLIGKIKFILQGIDKKSKVFWWQMGIFLLPLADIVLSTIALNQAQYFLQTGRHKGVQMKKLFFRMSIICIILQVEAIGIICFINEGFPSEWLSLGGIILAILIGSFSLAWLGECIFRENKGAIRLGVLISVFWILGSFIFVEPYARRYTPSLWTEFVIIGIIPVVSYAGVLWVIMGFLSGKKEIENK